VTNLPSSPGFDYSSFQLVTDIYEIGKAHWSSNKLFISVLTVFGIFSEAEVMEVIEPENGGVLWCVFFSLMYG
jgi:hypothetical protein